MQNLFGNQWGSRTSLFGGNGDDVLAGKAKIFDIDGLDVTEQMIVGSKKALKICLKRNVTKAFLQTKSPTCGYNKIYDGTFSSKLKQGNGIFSALLMENGIKVIEIE